MKKFKKLAALLLALTMVFALAACGTDGDNNSQAPSDNPPASEPANPDDSNSAEPAPGGDVQTNEDGMTYVNVTGDIDLSGVDLSGKTFGYVTINSSAPGAAAWAPSSPVWLRRPALRSSPWTPTPTPMT